MDKIIYIPNFIENDNLQIYNSIYNKTKWNKINYFKRSVSHYDGNIDEINNIIIKIQETFGKNVISAFLNYYENGNDYAPYHSDNYGCDACLVSFGTSRILRYKENSTKINTDFILNEGDLLFIPDEINNNYKHSLLKRTKINSPRISILFFLHN
jgi:alkylated DNA repair dioxygenase AlkB